MTQQQFYNKHFSNKIQTICFELNGTIIESNNLIFLATKYDKIQEIHPFFEIITQELLQSNQELVFNTIEISIEDKIIITDIYLFSGNKNESPTLYILDYSKHYFDVQHVTQQKNEVFISDALKHQKLIRNEQEKQFKNQFLSGITKDLKVPITSISGMLELFHNSPLTYDQQELLKLIRNSMSQLNRLTHDVLDLAQLDLKTFKIATGSFNFDDFMINFEKQYLHRFLEKGISLQIIKDKAIPQHLIGDHQRVFQVISNLMESILHHTNIGANIVIQIKTDSKFANKIGLIFILQDPIIGLNENLINLFKINFAKTKQQDFGVGLSIVNNLVLALNGSMSYESKSVLESTINLYLPFEIDLEKKINLKTTVFKKREITINKNVLIVDDNEINQLILMKLLIDHGGFYIEIANTLDRTIQMINNNSYDLVILDLQITSLDVFEVIQFIKNNKNKVIKATNIMVLSAPLSEIEKKNLKKATILNCIIKPYSFEEFFENTYICINI